MIDNQHGKARFNGKILRQAMEQMTNPSSIFTLHVSDAPNEKVIYFVSGGIRLLSVGERRTEDIESHLLSSGAVGIEDLHAALESSRKNRKTLKEALVAAKVLTAKEYSEVVNRLIRNELLDLVFWEDAFFTCYTGSPPQELYRQDGKALVGSPNGTRLEEDVCEWSKQWDRLRGILKSDRAVLSATRSGLYGVEKLEGEKKRVLELCLDPVDLRQLWSASKVNIPELCTILEELIENRWVEVSPPDTDNSPEAKALQIEMLEDCLEKVIGKDMVREKLILLYRKTERFADASRELLSLAESALREAQWPLAVERFKQVLSM
ncbi:MAG: DUF4388 domain-containing protein, partial [Planctomycetota bacterium]